MIVIRSALRHGVVRAALVIGVVLAYGVGLWMTLLRHFEGGHHHGGPSLLVHWLGAATIALPFVILSVGSALALARSLTGREHHSLFARRAVAAAAAAPAASLAFAAAYPARVWLFGANEVDSLPPPVQHATVRCLVDLVGSLAAGRRTRSTATAGPTTRWCARPTG